MSEENQKMIEQKEYELDDLYLKIRQLKFDAKQMKEAIRLELPMKMQKRQLEQTRKNIEMFETQREQVKIGLEELKKKEKK
jgi:hypothetical protein